MRGVMGSQGGESKVRFENVHLRSRLPAPQAASHAFLILLQWQRAETLGALINGVFLVALCMSIFLEAIQRIVQPQEVSRPMLVLIVGCCGLASNIMGLFLFHEHGHGHGEHSHDHTHASQDQLSAAEEGHASNSHNGTDDDAMPVVDEDGSAAENVQDHKAGGGSAPKNKGSGRSVSVDLPRSHKEREPGVGAPLSRHMSPDDRRHGPARHSRSRSRAYTSLDEIRVHPASFRHEIIAASRLEEFDSASGSDMEADHSSLDDSLASPAEDAPLISRSKSAGSASHKPLKRVKRNEGTGQWHVGHRHSQPKSRDHKGGHSHGDLNMRGVFLHVLGDALGNIGVIGSALVIWLTDYWWRFYADPVISLLITGIILWSAIPLCKAASRILLQAVPVGLNIDDIKADIDRLPGIVSAHHLHVWQLSDTKLVASVHVQVEFDFKGEGSARYMTLARAIRRCLHEYGIHSSTIQPEFCLEASHDHSTTVTAFDDDDDCPLEHESGAAGSPGRGKSSKQASKCSSLRGDPDACLLECDEECGNGKQCCAPSATPSAHHDDDSHNH